MDRDYFRIGMRVQVCLPKDYGPEDYTGFNSASKSMAGLCGTIQDIDPEDGDACVHFPFSDVYHWYPLNVLAEVDRITAPADPAPPGVIFDGPFSF